MEEFIHLSGHSAHSNKHVLLLLIPILVFITFAFLFFKQINISGQRAYSTQDNQAVLGEETQAK